MPRLTPLHGGAMLDRKCFLLGRAERVTAPTALPTVMESADGPPGGPEASTRVPCSQALALGRTP